MSKFLHLYGILKAELKGNKFESWFFGTFKLHQELCKLSCINTRLHSITSNVFLSCEHSKTLGDIWD